MNLHPVGTRHIFGPSSGSADVHERQRIFQLRAIRRPAGASQMSSGLIPNPACSPAPKTSQHSGLGDNARHQRIACTGQQGAAALFHEGQQAAGYHGRSTRSWWWRGFRGRGGSRLVECLFCHSHAVDGAISLSEPSANVDWGNHACDHCLAAPCELQRSSAKNTIEPGCCVAGVNPIEAA